MKVKRMSQTPAEVAEDENLRATVAAQKEKIEGQKVTMQYVAMMSGIYLPEETEEEEDTENVQNSDENEENV